jgi:hypothetical protein
MMKVGEMPKVTIEGFDNAKKALESFGLTITQDLMEDIVRFRTGNVDMQAMLLGIKIVIVREVLPTLVDFGKWFRGEIPGILQFVNNLVKDIRLASTDIGFAWTAMKTATSVAWTQAKEIIVGGVNSFKAAISFQSELAQKEWEVGINRAVLAAKRGAKELTDAKNEWLKSRNEILSPEKPKLPKASEGGETEVPNKNKGGGGGGSTLLQQWKEELEKIKVEENKYLDFSKQAERQFWQAKLELCKEGSKEYSSVRHELFNIDKALAKDEAQAHISELDRQIAADKTAWDKKRTLISEEVTYVKEKWGEQSNEYRGVLKKQQALDVEYHKFLKDLEVSRLENKLQLAQMDIARQEQQVKFEEQIGLISAQQSMTRLKALKEQELKLEQDTTTKKKIIRQGDEKAMEQLMQQEEAFHQKKLTEMDKSEQQMALSNKQRIQNILSPIESAISTSITGIIQGTTTLSQAISNLGQSIVTSFVGFLAKMVMEWAAAQLAMLIFGKTSATGEIGSKAGIAAAAGFASVMAALPFPANIAVAPEVAMAAGAGAMASGMSFTMASAEGGWWQVPRTTTTTLHPNEMVLPAWAAERVRNMIQPGQSAQSPAPVQNHFHIQAWDSESMGQFVQRHSNVFYNAQCQPLRNSRPISTWKNINGQGKY